MKTTLHANGQSLAVEYDKQGNDYALVIDGQPVQARLLAALDGSLTLLVNDKPLRAHVARDGQRTLVSIEGRVYEFSHAPEKKARFNTRDAGRLDPEIRSPMPGKILQVPVAAGEQVEAGQTLVVVEAMKMENALKAEGAGHVTKIHISPGDSVELGQLLVELEFSIPEVAAPQAN